MYSFNFNDRKSVDKYAVLCQEKNSDMKLDYAQYFKTAEEAIKYIINVEMSSSYNGYLIYSGKMIVSAFPNMLTICIDSEGNDDNDPQYIVTGLNEKEIKIALSTLDSFEKNRQEKLKNQFNPENEDL